MKYCLSFCVVERMKLLFWKLFVATFKIRRSLYCGSIWKRMLHFGHLDLGNISHNFTIPVNSLIILQSQSYHIFGLIQLFTFRKRENTWTSKFWLLYMNKYLVIEMHCLILAILYGTLLSVNEQMYVNVYIYSHVEILVNRKVVLDLT